MATNREEGIADEVLDRLLAGRDPATVFETGGLVDELKKRLAERMLNAEMDHHLGGVTRWTVLGCGIKSLYDKFSRSQWAIDN